MSASSHTGARPALPLGVSLGERYARHWAEARSGMATRRRLRPLLLLLAELAALAGAIAIALALRLHNLDAQSLWLDEGFSVWLAEQSLGDLYRELNSTFVHPPLYFFLLHFWTQVSSDVLWIRLLSVIASVLTVVFAYAIGRRIYGPIAGVLAAFLLAISPFNVYYAQEARSYSLLALGATACTYFLIRALQDKTRLAWIFYAVSGAVLLYVHNVALFVLLAHALVLVTLMLMRRREGVLGLRSIGFALAVWSPWLPTVFKQSEAGGAGWLGNPMPEVVKQVGVSFTSAYLPESLELPVLGDLPRVGLAIVLAYCVALVAVGILALRTTKLWMFIVSVILIGPFLLELDAGVILPVFMDRTVIFVSVTFLVVIAGALVALAKRPAGAVLALLALAGIVSLNVTSLRQYYNMSDGQDVKEMWNRAAARVAAHERSGDVILFQTSSAEVPFDYYYSRISNSELPKVGIPCPAKQCTREEKEQLAAAVEKYDRIWLVKRWWGNWEFTISDALGDYAGNLRRRDWHAMEGVVIVLYENAASQGVGA